MRRLALLLCLLLSPLAEAGDVSGLWVGYYAYEPGAAIERVECAMVLEDYEGEVGGAMVERQTFGDEILPGLPADLLGFATEDGVEFEKYYFHNEEDAEPVYYELALSPDGNTLSGYWEIGETSGTAFFRRVTASSAERIPAPR